MNNNYRAAIVTGAASGIGLETARLFASQGYDVALVDRDHSRLLHAIDQIHTDSQIHAVAADLSTVPGARSAIETSIAALPHAETLVCCAGVLQPGNLLELRVDSWDEMFDLHARAPVLMAQSFIASTRTSALANPRRHRIVAVSSTAAVRPRAGNGAYAASKSALNMAFRVLAVEVAPFGFNVNVVTPGLTNTPMVTAGTDNAGTSGWQPSSMPPVGRMAEPSDIASGIRFLCGEDASFVTGANLVIDGGSSAAVRGG
ncbi:SDR family NAD(P)-dependent oxidoreductase [Rhodococcus sp. NPDC019627]|jgi:3-oxoacyl-[acyl-carrier protein] reductase|uniref:SDR family NAD(P)-dependent oxidoreductase n=1 Tax=unclassified Rhodococcus (in: high G+C Gram-positive bacteria) TaxID=192944 RepID=UPI00340ECFD8